jgi:hypothetical protein
LIRNLRQYAGPVSRRIRNLLSPDAAQEAGRLLSGTVQLDP